MARLALAMESMVCTEGKKVDGLQAAKMAEQVSIRFRWAGSMLKTPLPWPE
jgi:hypothetical protein